MRRILQFAALPLSTLLLLVGCGADHSSSVLAPPTANADVSMISMMKFAQDDWSLPVRLGDAVNTAFNEQGPTLSPDALSLYFCSNKPGGQGGNDIWVSHRASEESDWEPAVNLGPVINSQFGDCGPNISPDGHLLFFTSARPGIGQSRSQATGRRRYRERRETDSRTCRDHCPRRHRYLARCS